MSSEGLGRKSPSTNCKIKQDRPLETENKGHTFRKRRLSLTNLRQLESDGEDTSHRKMVETLEQQPSSRIEVASATADFKVSSEKRAHSFRKRRLSLTHVRQDDPTGGDDYDTSSAKLLRRNSEASVDTIDSNSNNLPSRTAHSTELLSYPPPSPSISAVGVPKLYQQATLPQHPPLLDFLHESGSAPKWKKRHTRHKDEKSLPFPTNVVGTFSCHGVEPIYETDYQPEFENQEGEEDDEFVVGSSGLREDEGLPNFVAEKPTIMAKTNQDRGGVAFPYGNCPRTALFAVYDGTLNLFFVFGRFEPSLQDTLSLQHICWPQASVMSRFTLSRSWTGWRTHFTICTTRSPTSAGET
jgi:hypothetical protein